jgi:hypothetical protein
MNGPFETNLHEATLPLTVLMWLDSELQRMEQQKRPGTSYRTNGRRVLTCDGPMHRKCSTGHSTRRTSIQDHIKLLRTRKAAVDNLSTASMSDETWQGVIIRSIPPTPNWLPVIPSLYTLTSSADIVSTLLAHGMILDQRNQGKPTASGSNTVLAA